MITTPARKHSISRQPVRLLSRAKRKALRRRGIRALRYWKHLTNCFGAFHRRSSRVTHALVRTLRRILAPALLAFCLPTLAQAETFTVTTNTDTSNPNDGALTLREAIVLANANEGPDTIDFAEALSGEVIVLTQGELAITDDLHIDASDLDDAPVIDADQQSRVMLYGAEEGDLRLDKLVLRNGKTSENGGGILFESAGEITLAGSALYGNRSGDYGGGVASDTGAVTLFDSTVSENSADYGGGGISSGGGAITLTNSEVSGNSAGYDGGGINSGGGAVTLTNSKISGNSATYEGGGIRSLRGAVTLTNSTISRNFGGGICSYHGAVTLTNSVLKENSAFDGGGIFTSDGAVTLTNSTVSGNKAAHHGGGVSSKSGTITLRKSTLAGNSADRGGGGISSGSGAIHLSESSVSDNSTHVGGWVRNHSGQAFTFYSAGDGGGIESDSGPVILTNSTVSNNSAAGRGGGISSQGGTLTLINSTVSGNSTKYARYHVTRPFGGYRAIEVGDGGGIFSDSGTITLANSTLRGNLAAGPGGGILPGSGQLSLLNSIIAGNSDDGTAPDLAAPEAPSTNLTASSSLIGDSTGARLHEAASNLNNLIGVDPLLGPLADNGGPTMTMLPLPGSPLIDAGQAGGPFNDQRGLERADLPDIGAVEYQGTSDFRRAFDTDHDGDGHSYGLEQALGTDPFRADRTDPRNFGVPTFNSAGEPMLHIGVAGDAHPETIWILERTTDLEVFDEIYRFDGTDHVHVEGAVGVALSTTGVTITDQAPPSGRHALYRIRIEFGSAG